MQLEIKFVIKKLNKHKWEVDAVVEEGEERERNKREREVTTRVWGREEKKER